MVMGCCLDSEVLGIFRDDRDDLREETSTRLWESIKILRDLGLASEPESEVLRCLIDGPRNITELVDIIYGATRNTPGFGADYMKISRVIRRLENKGLVSTRILGRDKPYKLTPYALEKLYFLGRPGESAQGLVGFVDLLAYLITLGSGTAMIFLQQSPWLGVVFGAFLYSLGISTCRIVRMLRRLS
jgi:hypothetical protein